MAHTHSTHALFVDASPYPASDVVGTTKNISKQIVSVTEACTFSSKKRGNIWNSLRGLGTNRLHKHTRNRMLASIDSSMHAAQLMETMPKTHQLWSIYHDLSESEIFMLVYVRSDRYPFASHNSSCNSI